MSFGTKLARGLLQGAAGYYTQVAKEQDDDRKLTALAQRESALKQLDSQLADQRAGRQAERDRVTNSQKIEDEAGAKAGLIPLETGAQVTVEGAKGRIKGALQKDQQRHEIALAYVKGSIDQKNDAASIQLRHKLEAGDVQSIEPGKDGNYHVIFKNGTTQDTGVATPPTSKVEFQGTNDSGDLVVGRDDGSISTIGGVKPKPAVDPFNLGSGPTSLPGGGAGSTSPRPISVTTQAPDGGGAAPSKPPNTYTTSDLQYTASKYGISTDEARRRLNAAGYRLTN